MKLTIEQLELAAWCANYLNKHIETDNLYYDDLRNQINKDLKEYPSMVKDDLEEVLSNLMNLLQNI